MAVDARAIGAGSIRESDNLTPAISNLQLAFKNGVISGQEIADSLIVKPGQQKLQRAQNLASLDLLPLQQEATQLQLEGQIAQAPAQAALAELELQRAQGAGEAALGIQDEVSRGNQLQVEQQNAEFEGILGAQPFANPQNAATFFERTRPGEKIPTNPQKLEQMNQEAFNAIQQFKLEMGRFSGKQTSESFTRVNPTTFDQERVKVLFDGAGRVLSETVLGTTQVGSKSLTEQQANAVQFSARMRQAQANMNGIEDSGFDPAGIVNHMGQFLSRVKLGGLASSSAQQYEAAKRNWMSAVLRKESGAAIAQSEYKGADHQYFPQPKDTPATIAQKRALRDTALGTMQAAGLFGLPPAQKSIIEAQFSGDVGPSSGPIKAVSDVISDSEFAEQQQVGQAPAPAQGERLPSVHDAPPTVNSAAEAQQLPPDVQFFLTPDGRTLRNPNFSAPRPGASSLGGVRG